MDTISTLAVTGADALEFLQGQLSNDLKRLDTQSEIKTAWCNPKGRVIWFGTVSAAQAGYELAVPTDMVADMVNRLTMFRFRSKVDFNVSADSRDINVADLIQAGIPYIGGQQSEQFTPHMLNLDLLDAISFDKGCYTGQEIVARTHYKGATKRRTLRFTSEAPVSVGDKISHGDRHVGEVLNAAGSALLAVMNVEVADKPLTINGAPIKRADMPYDVSAGDTGNSD
jgi:folate-binding protein YgfZ